MQTASQNAAGEAGEPTRQINRGSTVKLCKWHTLIFRCPKCGKETDYALQVGDGPHKGTSWDPAYWCEQCNTLARAREPWLFGAVYGPAMALIAALAYEAFPAIAQVPTWSCIVFACVCCVIIGWPLSRYLSRHLVAWETRESRPATRA